MAEYPRNFRYDEIMKTLAWDGVERAVEYDIQDHIDRTEQWNQTYLGRTRNAPLINYQGFIMLKVGLKTLKVEDWEYGDQLNKLLYNRLFQPIHQ